jgi:acyl carrier protein
LEIQAMTLFDAVAEVFVKLFKFDLTQIVPEARFEDDLGLDSLGEVELAMALQKRFGVVLTDDEMLEMKFVSQIVDNLAGKGVTVE